VHTSAVKIDIDSHQYIPGIFPMSPTAVHEVTQHSIHHFGRLEPYGLAVKSDQVNISEAAREAAGKMTVSFPSRCATRSCWMSN
jgi:hypothetical protein